MQPLAAGISGALACNPSTLYHLIMDHSIAGTQNTTRRLSPGWVTSRLTVTPFGGSARSRPPPLNRFYPNTRPHRLAVRHLTPVDGSYLNQFERCPLAPALSPSPTLASLPQFSKQRNPCPPNSRPQASSLAAVGATQPDGRGHEILDKLVSASEQPSLMGSPAPAPPGILRTSND